MKIKKMMKNQIFRQYKEREIIEREREREKEREIIESQKFSKK